ncbi:MAG: thiol reductant ABC exporter subunit CydD [Rubrobacter sp.]|nr:thiol reductant ABC exporter subunit CydD [Rubrobacter sp.]
MHRQVFPPADLGSVGQAESKRFLKAQFASGRRYVFSAALAGLGVTLCVILQAFAFATVIDSVAIEGGGIGDVSRWFVVFGVAVVLKALLVYLLERFGSEGALKIQRHIRHEILDRLFSRDDAAFHSQTAQTAGALIEQVDKLEPYYARYYPQLLLTVLSPLAMLIAIFPTNWVVGLMLLLAAPTIPFYMALIGMGAEAVSRRQFEALRHLSGYFLDRLQGLQTLKRLGYAEHELKNIAAASNELQRRTMSVLRVAFLSSAVLEFYSTFAVAIVATYIGFCLLGYLHFGVGSEGMSLQVGFFLLLLAPAYFQPMRDFAATYHDRADAIAAAQDLVPLTAPQATPLGRVTARPVLRSVESIEFREATVRFGGRKHPALQDVNLTVRTGQKIAITGPSGAGKSTLLGVVAGQVPVDRGEVLVNGFSINDLAPDSLREHTSWVGQRPYLFPDTIAENVALGQPEKSRQATEEASHQARITDFAARLPAGLDTVIGERGAGLSGGEAQRVALARAFLKDAPLVLFDEPTAHLDAATEAELIETIAALLVGKTVLIATHSPALIDLCDGIVRLEGGVLKELHHA